MPGGHLYLFLQSSSSENSFLRLPHRTLWDDAMRAGALDALPHNTRMHLACHGKQDHNERRTSETPIFGVNSDFGAPNLPEILTIYAHFYIALAIPGSPTPLASFPHLALFWMVPVPSLSKCQSVTCGLNRQQSTPSLGDYKDFRCVATRPSNVPQLWEAVQIDKAAVVACCAVWV
ncbi:uncharacterized protein HD556DRAFT_1302796 [Suillus plorans]|uniref:Uncharacterized protein n=1 Tax=Suillus plorans TaxID=116603 RepID=A0A9P7DY38_9AGAM|nr:uncharacterized protein HD556DRAFT_1302796 [Suillus plorans]KAG1806277.1 hypothetical protein HD556DRAFT_1302796 [Suillus plorans]